MTFSSTFDRWTQNNGQVSTIFALTLLPLLTVVGVAVDLNRQVNIQNHLSHSVDFASLAGVRGFADLSNTDEDIKALANSAFLAQMRSSHGDVSCERPNVSVDRPTFSVSVSGQCSIPTIFGKQISGFDTMSVRRDASATAEMTKIEVALMLDISSSMEGDRLNALKTATTRFVTNMVHPFEDANVKVSIIPYGTVVNAGIYGNRAMGRFDFDDRAGDGADKVCVREREGLDRYTDRTPGPGSWIEEMIPWAAGITCPESGELIPLSADRTALLEAIDNLAITEEQWTGGHIATAWSWYTLSPNWGSIWPSSAAPANYDDEDTQKIVVMMTDGQFNEEYDEHLSAGYAMIVAPQICEAMKDEDIEIYSIGFDVDANLNMSNPFYFLSPHSVLSRCASDASKVFFPQTGYSLIDVFENLGISLRGTQVTE